MQNRVNDVTKSREQWRGETEQLTERVQELEAENAALQEQMAALKKDGLLPAAGPAR
jgi:predicted nuclease with TOPRIM domain